MRGGLRKDQRTRWCSVECEPNLCYLNTYRENMFFNRRNYYAGYPYISAYTQAQIQQYRQHALASQAKLHAYREALIEAQNQNRVKDPVTFVGEVSRASNPQTPVPTSHEFTPVGHVSRPGSTVQSYSLWGSGNSSSNSDDVHRQRFGQTLCKVVTGCAVLLLILGVLGVVGVAIYLGYMPETQNEPEYSEMYTGKLYVEKGDSWIPQLSLATSPSFRAKSTKYNNMLKKLYSTSVLGQSFREVGVTYFKPISPGFEVHFRLALDRRKLPWRLPSTERVVKQILQEEVRSMSPVSFHSVKVNPQSILIQREGGIESPRPPERKPVEPHVEVVPLNGAGSIIRRRPHVVGTVINPAESKPKVNQRPPSREPQNKNLPKVLLGTRQTTKPSLTTTKRTTLPPTKPTTTTTTPTTTTTTTTTTEPTTSTTSTSTTTTTTTTPKPEIFSLSPVFSKPISIERDFKPSDPEYTALTTSRAPPTERPSSYFTRRKFHSWRPSTPKPHRSTHRPMKFIIENQPVSVIHSLPVEDTDGHHTLTVVEAPVNLNKYSYNDQPTNLEKIIESISKHSTTVEPTTEPSLKFWRTPRPYPPRGWVKPTSNWSSNERTYVNHPSKLLETHYTSQHKVRNSNDQSEDTLEQVDRFSVDSNSGSQDRLILNRPDQHDRMDFVPDYEEPQIEDDPPPSKSDIRSILEDLLFLGKPSSGERSSFMETLKSLFASPPKPKDDNIILEIPPTDVPKLPNPVVGSHFEVVGSPEMPIQKPYIPVRVPASNPLKDLPFIISKPSNAHIPSSSSTTTPTTTTTSSSTTRRLPIDKFRINAQYKTNEKETTPKPLQPSIWKILSTEKPLILNMQVITSKSTDIEYGTTKNLKPVYVSTTTTPRPTDDFRLSLTSNLIWPTVEIPVISDTELRYIKVNRSRENYPKVVIVNLPEHDHSDDQFEGRSHLNTEFADVLKLFQFLKNTNETSLSLESQHPKLDIHEEDSQLNSTVWPLFSTLEKLYKSHPSIIRRLYEYTFIKSDDKIPNGIRNPSELPHITTLLLRDSGGHREARVLDINKKVTSQSTTNSPIHTFTFKEEQTIEDLITEIFDTIANGDAIDDVTDGNNQRPSNKAIGQIDNAKIPLGQDYLMIIEAISDVLSGSYNKYNSVFDASESELSSREEPSPIRGTISTNVKEPQKTKYHKYRHELFPVMTRPMNPIRTTTSLPIQDDVMKTSSTTSHSAVTESTTVDSGSGSFKNDEFSSLFDSFKNKTGCSSNEFKCEDGACISQEKYCDKEKHCEDGSDEASCTCADILRSEGYFRKICDGIIDCWDKTDEIHCDWCTPNSFICSGDKKCIPPEKVCDGFPDCPSGDDERECVKIAPNSTGANSLNYFDEGYLMVRRNGKWGKFCVGNFEETVKKAEISWKIDDLGEAVCSTLTFGSFEDISTEKDSDSSKIIPYYKMNITSGNDVSSRGRGLLRARRSPDTSNQIASLTRTITDISRKREFPPSWKQQKVQRFIRDAYSFDMSLRFQETACPTRDVVKVTCKGLLCGVRPRAVTQQARIVGGSNSSPGAWPWHAALYKEGEYQCGATLINEHWLISAGHCFFSSKGDHWVARVGALRRGTNFPSPFEQVRTIDHIFIHPDYVNQGFINDISVVRVTQPIKFNDYIRPVCLPTPGTEVNDGRRCTLVGWGQLFEVKKVFPDTLQEVEVPLISTNECRKRTVFLPLYRITEDMFCAGYDRGGRDACLGDSGGPLMCQKDDGRWEVVGITSNGYGCARPHRPGVYTKLVNYLSWIEQVMELGESDSVKPLPKTCDGIRCPLGQCLHHSSICNGVMECSDGSDERNC